jgi:hypothetical protein
VCDNHAPARYLWGDLRQLLGDILVRESVESVATNAFRVEALRDRVSVRDLVVSAVKSSVETGDLRQTWKSLEQDTDWRQIVRLMEGRQR